MIRYLKDEIRAFVAFISDNNIPSVDLLILPDCDTGEAENAESDFAVYIPSEKRIVVGKCVDPDIRNAILKSLAREYCHHIQNCEGRDFDEDEAEKYAELKFNLWIQKKRPIPRRGEIYRHFKGIEYGVVGIVINANNDETDEEPQVLYIREDDFNKIDKRYYRRRVEEFLSPVDREKYPDAKQFWRFEKVEV